MTIPQTDTAKLVIAGPVGAGKTTAIRAIADSDPVSTEMAMSEGPMGDKTTTTVALDFSTVMLDDGTPLFIYGLPGQERFAHMRSIVIAGAVGVVLALDSTEPDIAGICADWLQSIRAVQPDIPVVVGVTKTDCAERFSLGALRRTIRDCGPPVPVFTFDARDREQTEQLVRALLLSAA